MRGTCSQHAGAAVAADPRVLRGSPHSFERKRVPPLFLLSAPMVGGRDWSSGGRARDAPAARARRREDAARAAALTERAALTSFDRPPIVIKRTFPRGISPWDVSHRACYQYRSNSVLCSLRLRNASRGDTLLFFKFSCASCVIREPRVTAAADAHAGPTAHRHRSPHTDTHDRTEITRR